MKGSLKYLVKQVLLFFACFDINKYELDNEAYHELWAYVLKKQAILCDQIVVFSQALLHLYCAISSD